jgi:hypothetical protein
MTPEVEFFTHDAVKNGLINDENVLGVLISTHFEWDGTGIKHALKHYKRPLEDSNFHKVNKALGETWKTIEGANHA